VLTWKEILVLDGQSESVKREVDIGMKVESPFVAKPLDCFEEDFTLYIVEEYYEDGTLFTFSEELKKSGESITKEVFQNNFFFSFSFYIFRYYYYLCD
jgi:hypothetical protein